MNRVRSIDIIRGAVMVLMAIDHVRVYSGQPAGGPTAGIFFTRWVTHFCAPVFCFYAGTSAYLYGRKLGNTSALARHLLLRGLLLVVLELTVIRFSWTFNFDYGSFTLAGVIWMLGWCMVLLAPMVLLSPRIAGWAGLAIIAFQQVFSLPKLGPIWEFVYPAGGKSPGIEILYVIVPWIGVMAAGYGFGLIATDRRWCLRIGAIATALFLAAGTVGVVMHPGKLPFLFQLLNQQKYPASQLFLLMTLGPAILAMPFAEKMRGWFADVLSIFGRVPLFYYLLHIPTIHLAALAVDAFRDAGVHPEWFRSAPYTSVPPQQRWSLALLYLVFAAVVAILYFPCRWYANRKAS